MLEDLAESTYRTTVYQSSYRDWKKRAESGTREQVNVAKDQQVERSIERIEDDENEQKDNEQKLAQTDSATEQFEECTLDKEYISSTKESIHSRSEQQSGDGNEACAELTVGLGAENHERRPEPAGLVVPARFCLLTKCPTTLPTLSKDASTRFPSAGDVTQRVHSNSREVIEVKYGLIKEHPSSTTSNVPASSTGVREKHVSRDNVKVNAPSVKLPSINTGPVLPSNGCHRKLCRPSIHGMRFKTEAHRRCVMYEAALAVSRPGYARNVNYVVIILVPEHNHVRGVLVLISSSQSPICFCC